MEPPPKAEILDSEKSAGGSSPDGNISPDEEKQVEKQDDDDQNDPYKVRPIHGWKWFSTCAAIYLIGLLYGLDTTIAADVQPDIVASLGEIEKLTWVGAGFPLGGVAVILPLGYAYGLFEIKKLYLSSIILFEVGSAVCGAAPTMNALIVGRIIAGAGGAGMYLGVLNYLATFTTLKERNIYNAIVAMVWGLGAILGPLVGGGFASSSATWRWAFYINLVLAVVMAPAFLFLLPPHQPRPNESLGHKLRYMDWLGIVLIAAVYTTYILALTFGGPQWPFDDYRFIVTIVFCGVTLIAFVLTQYFAVLTTKERRLFPGHFLRSRTLVLCFICTSASVTSIFLGAYYIPLIFQFARGDSAIKAAVRLLPFIVIAIVSILFNGIFMPFFGYYMPWYVASGVFTTIGASLLHTVEPDTAPANIYGYSVLFAIGAGCAFQSAYSIAAVKVKPEEVAAAIGFLNVAQTGTIVISLGIAGSIFQNVGFSNLKHNLAQAIAPGQQMFSDAEIRNAISGTQSEIFQGGNAAIQDASLKAVIDAIGSVYIMGIAGGAVTLVAAAFMRREKLFQKPGAGG